MNSMTAMERHMAIDVRCDLFAGEEFRGHRSNNGSAGWIKALDDVIHQRQSDIGQTIPAGFLADDNIWPLVQINENKHDGFGVVMDLVLFLAVLIFLSTGPSSRNGVSMFINILRDVPIGR
jgi:hypothetical protein